MHCQKDTIMQISIEMSVIKIDNDEGGRYEQASLMAIVNTQFGEAKRHCEHRGRSDQRQK